MANKDANSIANCIKNEILIGASSNVKIKEESFIYEILKDRGEWNSIKVATKKGWRIFNKKKSLHSFILFLFLIKRTILKSVKINFIRLFATFILCVILLIIGILFFVNGVLFFKNYNEIYKEGTIVTKQSLNKEHMMFLFSASDLWSNTGIKVKKGDLMKISASGGFNSSISDIIDDSYENKNLKRKWINITDNNSAKNKRPTIYTGKDSYFGSLLMQIQPEISACINHQVSKGVPIFKFSNNQNIWQITKDMVNKYFYVAKTGNVYFAINDIYLSDNIIEKYCSDSTLSPELFYIQQNGVRTDAKNCDTVINKLKTFFSTTRNCWFNDNVGEVLVCIEIIRSKGSITTWFNYISICFIRILDKYYLYFIAVTLLALIYFLYKKIKHPKHET